ncbi:MAG: cell division protein FtsZ, partial [Asticcacaulis sp.]
AFGMADQVLHSGVRSITDLMVLPGLINLDFADVRAVMSDMGKAMMGTGEAGGEDRAIQAAQNAIQNPLLDETSLKGAKAVLVNVTGGLDMTLLEVDEAANAISSEVDPDANIIFGAAFDPMLEGKLRVSVVATGMEGRAQDVIEPRPAAVGNRQSGGRPLDNRAPAAVDAPVQAPAPVQPPVIEPAPVMAQAAVEPAPQPAPVAPAPVAQAPAYDAVTAPISAPVAAAPATPQPAEPRIISRIVDPAVDEASDAGALFDRAAPRGGSRLDNARGTQAPAQPEPERKGGWRSLFAGRTRYETAVPYTPPRNSRPADPVPQSQPAPQARNEAPARAPEAEDDLEIPSFLRRLAN